MLESPNRKLKVLNENEKTKQKMREIQKKLNNQKDRRPINIPGNAADIANQYKTMRKSSKSAKANAVVANTSEGAVETTPNKENFDDADGKTSSRKQNRNLETKSRNLPTILKNKDRSDLTNTAHSDSADDQLVNNTQKLTKATK